MIMTIVLLLWQCALLPVLMGGAYATISKRKQNITEQYGLGWVLLLALFMVVSAPLVLAGKPLSLLSKLWLLLSAVLTVVLLVIRVLNLKKSGKSGLGKEFPFVLTLALVLTGINFFVKAAADGDLIEIINRACATDAMYRFDPYTGNEMPIMKGHALAPFEMYYAMLSAVSKAAPAFLVRKLIPIFTIPMLLSIYDCVGGFFFEEEDKKRKLFVGAVVLFDLVTWLSGRGEGFLILSGAWHPQTLLCSAIIPMTMIVGMELWEENSKKQGFFARLLFLICLMLVAELVVYKGVLFWLVTLILTGIVGVIRRKQDGGVNR